MLISIKISMITIISIAKKAQLFRSGKEKNSDIINFAVPVRGNKNDKKILKALSIGEPDT